jgi:hypothetical protein
MFVPVFAMPLMTRMHAARSTAAAPQALRHGRCWFPGSDCGSVARRMNSRWTCGRGATSDQKGAGCNAAQVTVFNSVGFALEDYAALPFRRDAAAELGTGDVVELVPQSDDPKILYGVLHGNVPPVMRPLDERGTVPVTGRCAL